MRQDSRPRPQGDPNEATGVQRPLDANASRAERGRVSWWFCSPTSRPGAEGEQNRAYPNRTSMVIAKRVPLSNRGPVQHRVWSAPTESQKAL